MGIDIKSVLVGGLVAGVVIILSAATMVPVVGNEMELALARFNLPPMSNSAMGFFAVEALILGIVLVWLFAAMLPRIKHGIKTAFIVAFIVWLLAHFFANAAMVVYGFMPIKLSIIGTAWGFFELLAGSLIGTRFYKER